MPDVLTLATDVFAAAIGVTAALLLLTRLPFESSLKSLIATVGKSLSVVTSSRISDHWKERAVPAYSLKIFRASLALLAMMAGLLAAFAGAFTLAWWPLSENLTTAAERLLHWQSQLAALAVALAWWLRPGFLRRKPAAGDAGYSVAERALHELALGNRGVKQLAFRLDGMLPAPSRQGHRPVYVCGLARGGTTVLLNALAQTGCFETLTYRHMPFVTAPRLWIGASKPFRQSLATRERAHGDGVLVDADSPEAFEEVFWLMACEADFVKQLGLEPHDVSDGTLNDYRQFVASVLAASGHRNARYLAKGNNNLLRLGALRRAFPDATILVPFRHPLVHAASLQRQHQRFIDIHREDPFSEKYMSWLGHFEFGANMKPLLFDPGVAGENPSEPGFWLRYWHAVHEHLLAQPAAVTLWDHDAFTRAPADQLAVLARHVGVPEETLLRFAGTIERRELAGTDDVLPPETAALYRRCQDASLK